MSAENGLRQILIFNKTEVECFPERRLAMNKYGMAAIKSVKKMGQHIDLSPVDAWKNATIEIFGYGASQSKSCPKSTFGGLCETGVIKGVATGNYTRSTKNKKYAVNAIKYLKDHKGEIIDQDAMWRYVTNNSGISHNSQMNVVMSLFNEKLLDI